MSVNVETAWPWTVRAAASRVGRWDGKIGRQLRSQWE